MSQVIVESAGRTFKPKPTAKSRRKSMSSKFGAKRTFKKVIGRPMAELKAQDTIVAALTSQTGAAGITPSLTLNVPVLGSDFNNRLGRKINMKSLQWRLFLTQNTVGVAPTDCCRIVLVYDRQPNAGAATWGTLIRSTNQAGTNSSLTLDMINLDNRDRFVILRDFERSMGNTAAAGTPIQPSAMEFIIEGFMSLKGLEATYNGTNGGTQADITTGAIFLYFVSLGANVNFSLDGAIRLRFYDS